MSEYQRNSDKGLVDFKSEEVVFVANAQSDEWPGDIASDIFGFVDVQSFGLFGHWFGGLGKVGWFFNNFVLSGRLRAFAVFGCHHYDRRSNSKEKQVCASSWRSLVISCGSLKSQAFWRYILTS